MFFYFTKFLPQTVQLNIRHIYDPKLVKRIVL